MTETQLFMGDLIDWICDLNYGPDVERPLFELYEEEEVDQKLATRDKTLTGTGQIRFTKQYFQTAYGFGDDDIEMVAGKPVPGDATPSDFAQASPTRDPIDDLAGSLSPETLQGLAGKLLAPVMTLPSPMSCRGLADTRTSCRVRLE